MRLLSSLLSTFTVIIFIPVAVEAQSQSEVSRVAEALEWREIGPTIMGGRISDLAVVESDPAVFYVGTATGGVWKTQNSGITFDPIFDGQATASVGDVTVAPSNSNVIWVGTGEPQNRQSSPWGNGVYRSTDAGLSWAHMGLANTHHISRIQVHPHDPDIAYVAAMGHLWGSNPERGVYRTKDGGQNWELVLFVDENTGAIDLVMDPSDPQTLFAAMYQRQRKAWGFNGGGPGSGIYRTTDGGQNWIELTEGLPEGDKGRIGLDVYRRNGNFLCAIVEADARLPGQSFGQNNSDRTVRNGVYCSMDRGESWEHRSTTNNRPMYYSQIRIDPNDPERMYLGGSSMYRTSDGGRTFTSDAAAGVHLDHHALWINPENSDHMILGSDGGVSISWDRSDNWYQFRNLPLGQFYEIGVDMRDPYHVCGGLQDNGSWCAPSDTRSNQGIRTRDWYNVGSGDGFFTVMHPSNTSLMFAESQGGNLIRVNLETMERTRMRPIGRPDADGEMPQLRWNWDTPVVLSSHDENTLYIGSNILFRSDDLGQSFTAVSDDLTWSVDRDTLSIMGVLGSSAQMSRNDGQSSYGNLTAIAESPLNEAVIYTGADDGRVHVTRDSGQTWTDVTDRLEGLPSYAYVTRIVASNGEDGEVFAAFDNHRNDDFNSYLYHSENFGQDWKRIGSGLPASSLNALAQHPDNAELLFVGNEVGVYVSADAGVTWVQMGTGLPTVPVDDIKIHPRENDLIIGTHGRGVWIIDDISPLEHLSTNVMASNAHIFPIRRATSFNPYTPQGWTPGIFAAPNPPSGARIRYHLSSDVDELELRVTDATGKLVRDLEAQMTSGVHEVIWDLRLHLENGASESGRLGPRVLPGAYIVELVTGDDIVQREVSVRMDPRVEIGRRELMARHQVMMDSYRIGLALEEAERTLEEATAQLVAAGKLVEGRDDEGLTSEIQEVRDKLAALSEELDDSSGGGSAWRGVESSGAMPTADALYLIDESWAKAPGITEGVNAIISDVESILRQVYAPIAMPDLPNVLPIPSRGVL